jgi:hypothetical protein
MKKLLATFTILFLIFFFENGLSQSAGDYRTAAAGDWSASAIWETYDGANWVAAGSAPTGSEDITINDSVNVDLAVQVSGDIELEGTGILAVGVGSLTFENGSSYDHARDGGDIPDATWNTGSTCLVTGVTGDAPGNSNQDFYNFTWNCPDQSSNVDVSWSGNTIGGDLTVESSGTGPSQFRLTSSGDYTDSITINGNVIVTGGVLTATGSGTVMEYTLVVNGDITVTGGSYALSRGSGGNATWYLEGDLSVSDAEVRSSNPDAKFLFFGDASHTLSYNSVSYNGTINYELSENDTLDIADGPDSIDLPVNGTFTNWGQINTTGAVSFLNGSTYNHAINAGNIPTANWDAGSNCLITGVTDEAPGNRNQSYYNLTWNCPDQVSNLNMGFDEVTIGGDITIESTGASNRMYLCGPATGDTSIVTINGDIFLNGGAFSSNGTSNGNTVIEIFHNGDIFVTAGNFSVSRGSQGNGSGSTDWYLYGDSISISNATTQNSNPTAAKFIFAGTSTQNLSLTNVTFGGGGFPVEVDTGAILNMGISQIGGSGPFIVNSSATLECGNEGGLDSALQNSGTTTLSIEGNYTFNGEAAQITGSLLPDTVNDLTVNNSAGVTLSDDVLVNQNLTITDGSLDLDGNTITLGSTSVLNETPGNTVTGASGMITTTRDLNAPAGDNVAGLGAMLTSSANLGSTIIERYHSGATGGGNEGILRQFNITPASNSGLDATLRFYYDESELNGIPEANLLLFKSPDGSDGSWSSLGGTVNETDNYIELVGIDDFSYWTAADVNNPVPVELTSFSASIDGKFVTLNWITASELSNHGWEVERRKHIEKENFNDWRVIGFVKGAGDNLKQASYSFKDETAASGLFQYRLKQVDFDGTFEYSNIVEAELSGPTEFALFQNYPNPFNPETVIKFEVPVSSFVNLTVYNTVGEKVATLINQQMERGRYLWNYNASDLSSGIYIYRLTAGDNIFIKKMMLIK